ncbi:DNA polymerase III subunit alpha [Bacillus suaedae]|uniref:DNA polymerase III subunit alpha n=1 Tax=Halalkalibacter suaedae TaxID=2822140 RepID=A0A941AMC7_9BACI|nr:DNA polymerase III subunit alpha [Bacillus suaedae]MBP3949751.1 DNA polymerase III subunit alpha [Bacillus suaedae]
MIPIDVVSEFSLLSSTNRIEKLVEKAKDLGYQALALSDYHVMYGAVPFYRACLKFGIEPIFGLRLTIQINNMNKMLRVYAKNKQGYANLMKLSTLICHKEEKARFLTKEELLPYIGDLIVVLPYIDGPITLSLENGDVAEAIALVKEWFADYENCFIELQGDSKQDDRKHRYLCELANATGLTLIASHPAYFLEKDDAGAYQVARSIREGKKADEYPLSRREQSYYLKSPKELEQQFEGNEEALANTQLFSERCTVKLDLGHIQLPKYPSGEQGSVEKLRRLCEQGTRKRFDVITETIQARLEEELSVITRMGFSDYFLIVWDFMNFSKNQGILTGPGRGSAAGSLVAYVLEITDVDPLKYDLLFERFLNHERVSMPDIDIDFPDHRRDEVIDYVQRKYGKDHVAQIITFGTLAAKAVVRDVGKALGVQQYVIEQIVKEIPSTPGTTLKKAIAESERLSLLIAQSEEAKQLWEFSIRLEGLPRHASTHAAGVVISDKPLTDILALQSGSTGISLTQATMDVVEELGLLKFDFLGLRNLTLLEQIIRNIETSENKVISLEDLPLDDKKTFELLGKGETTGVFQLESTGMRRVLTNLQPTEFEDIVAVNALYRPGPMEFIPSYIKRKHREEQITFSHPDLEEILMNTYGVVIYQEQIMKISSKMADFSLAEADILRRAISKKKKNELEQQRMAFIKGSEQKGYSNHVASDVFSLIERFADYGFNRSHAVAYSLISYRLAYLKVHYPLAFFTALLSSTWHQHEKLAQLIQECKEAGFDILPPSINQSEALFSIEGKSIRFGLLPIAHVGMQAVKEILMKRKQNKLDDLFHFTLHVGAGVTKKVIESLIKAGAMDEFGEDRAVLLYSVDSAVQFAQSVKQFQQETEGLFTLDVQVPDYDKGIPPFSDQEKLEFEKEALGFYLSGHPIEPYFEQLKKLGRVTIKQAFVHSGQIRVAGLLGGVKRIRTKKGDPMGFAKLIDESEEADLTLFPIAWKKLEHQLTEGELFFVEGRTDISNKRRQIIVDRIIPLNTLGGTSAENERLFLRITSGKSPELLNEVKKVLHQHKGSTSVILFYEQTKATKHLSDEYKVSPNEQCLIQLKQLLGEEHVRLRR